MVLDFEDIQLVGFLLISYEILSCNNCEPIFIWWLPQSYDLIWLTCFADEQVDFLLPNLFKRKRVKDADAVQLENKEYVKFPDFDNVGTF